MIHERFARGHLPRYNGVHMNYFLWSLLLLQALAQPTTKSSINLFSLQDDIAIGAESAREAARSLPLVRDPAVSGYLNGIGVLLAGSSAEQSIHYTFQIVNQPEAANAETFPGGRIYLDRGLIELTASEHELAALIAHEIAHAAARHGTSQLSGQLLVQAPASFLGGLNTNSVDGLKEQLGRLGINLGARSIFLRHSREQEIEANKDAVDILVKSQYSPYGLASILKTINKPPDSTKAPLPGYAFNHPQNEDAAAQLDMEIAKRRVPRRVLKASPEYMEFRAALAKLPFPAPRGDVSGRMEPELRNEHVHPESYYRLRYPEGWQVFPTTNNGAMIAAPGGVVSTSAGNDLRTGIMFDLFSVPEKQTLEQATNRVLVYLRQRNQNLRPIAGAQSQMLIGSEPALRTVLISNSRPNQVVWVATRQYYESLFYLVCVAPEEDFAQIQPVFEQILRSIELR
jgi:beta-barrel assembly-enhancing protease